MTEFQKETLETVASGKHQFASADHLAASIGAALARIAELEARPAAIEPDPDMPRRFRWLEFGRWSELHTYRYGVYFPPNNAWAGDGGNSHFGQPAMPGLEWIDPAPAVKKGDVT